MESKYAHLVGDALEEHLSNYLVDSWSFSGVSTFARNEKAFEMQYIYRERRKSIISSVVGSAYHYALKQYFSSWANVSPDPVQMLQWAYDYLNGVPANEWRLGTRNPTVENSIEIATARINKLITSFCEEYEIYTEHVAEVLSVEVKDSAWVVINGVDIPLPCHIIIDLVVRLDDGRIVIIDHKSKSAYTAEDEIALVHGQQAIT